MQKEEASMFKYKTVLGSVIEKSKFVIAPRNNAYCIVASNGTFYSVYEIENFSIVERGPKVEAISAIGVFRRYVVTAGEDKKLRLYNRGFEILQKDLPIVPKDILTVEDSIYIIGDSSIFEMKVYVPEKKTVEQAAKEIKIECIEHAELANKRIHHVLRVGSSDKISVLADESLMIYCLSAQKVLYSLKCAQIINLKAVASSLSPSIIGVATEKEVLLINIKKDILLQRIPLENVISLDFRRDNISVKELIAATPSKMHIISLEHAAVKEKISFDRGDLQCMQFIGSEPFCVISQKNSLSIMDFRKKPIITKRKAGVILGTASSSLFFGNNLIVSTNEKIYSISLRKESQNKEISKMSCQGEALSLSTSRTSLLSVFSKSLHLLDASVGGLAKKKNRLSIGTNREYRGAVLSFCGRIAAVSLEHTETTSQIFIVSSDAGFIMGEITVPTPIVFSVNSLTKTLSLLYSEKVEVYSFDGTLHTRFSVPLCSCGTIIDERNTKHFLLANEEEFFFINSEGNILRSAKKTKGAALSIKITENLQWIYLVSALKDSSVLELFDVERGTLLAKNYLDFVPKDYHISPDRLHLLLLTSKDILLYENTAFTLSVQPEASIGERKGIFLSSAHKSRMRLLMEYETLGESIKKEDEDEEVRPAFSADLAAPDAGFLVDKENLQSTQPSKHDALNQEKEEESPFSQIESFSIRALLQENYPISKIIKHLKTSSDPTSLIIEISPYLSSHYDVVEALINRIIYYRRKDIDLEKLSSYFEKREEITESLLSLYLSTLSIS
ncbi:hypothetical protein NEFER01_0957 [Nematocida sp. LUAm1]|nr:hypothetical protein NEFER02_1239 [Nematocida sp. LUAm2]KAI5177733.1 hypothetical protein NEFER01_0957 [Nematocida sp. LUAm1]